MKEIALQRLSHALRVAPASFAGMALMAVAAANMLFLIAFVATLLLGATKVRAEEACAGENLIARMEAEAPHKLEAVRAEAANELNGRGLLWRIERPGVKPSWLFGTMHMSDPRVTTLPSKAEAAMAASSTLVIETTDVLDPARMAAAMLARPELTMFTDGTSLPDLLSPEDRAAVEAALAERGISLGAVQKMKPWLIAAMASLPSCEMARKSAGKPVLDVLLANRAKERGMAVEGLESAAGQLEAMASLPMDFHVRGLVETLKLGKRIDDIMETMIVLYLEGNIAAIWPFFRAELPPSGEDEAGYAVFQEAMIASRNRKMAEGAATYLDAGGVFLAVGALHLPGPEGLVELLRGQGWTVTPEG